MMRRPRTAPSETASLPSPTGGWNTRDPYDQMPPNMAIQLDNFFPDTSTCNLRNGYSQHVDTGETDPVSTLFPYSGNGTRKLLAAAGGSIFDVTSDPAVSLDTGYTSDVWAWTNHASGGGARLIACNDSGADVPWVFDGTAITPIAVTGVTDTNLKQPLLHAQRVFYVERNTLSVWYTTAGAYQGALTEFDFGQFCRKGGTIAAIGSWTRDNGAGGADDLFVVVTTEGEVLIYSGIDPAGAWQIVGVFACGKPITGVRCLVSTGPDLVLICSDGFQPLSDYLQYGSTRAGSTELAKYIANAAQSAVASYGTLAGWQGIIYGEQSMLIVNVPQSATTFYQYVANTTTGAWCRFIGMNAYCWSPFGTAVYFGGADGIVWRGLSGVSDNGADIVAEMVTSYQYVGGRGMNKRFTLCRPVLQTNGPLHYSLGVNVDYAAPGTLPTINSNTPTSGLWGSGLWGSARWGGSTRSLQRTWGGVSGIGYSVAVHILISTHTISANLNAFDLTFERGATI